MLNSTNSWSLNYFCFKNESLRILPHTCTTTRQTQIHRCGSPSYFLSESSKSWNEVIYYPSIRREVKYLVFMPLSSFSGLQRNVVHINLAHTTVTVFFSPVHVPILDFNCQNHTICILFVLTISSLLVVPCFFNNSESLVGVECSKMLVIFSQDFRVRDFV